MLFIQITLKSMEPTGKNFILGTYIVEINVLDADDTKLKKNVPFSLS